MSPISKFATLLAPTVLCSLASVSDGTFLGVNGQTVDVQAPKQEQHSQEMLENETMIAPCGKEDTATELQSHAARTQGTLVGVVENVEVTVDAGQQAAGLLSNLHRKLFRVQRHTRARTHGLPRQRSHERATQPSKDEHQQLHPKKPKHCAGTVWTRNVGPTTGSWIDT